MSLLSQLRDLKTQYLATNAEFLRTPVFIAGGIPLAQDPGKATRKTAIPHFVIWHHMPEPVYEVPDAGCVSRDAGHFSPEQDESEQLADVIA